MCYSITGLKYSKSILEEDIEAMKKYFLAPEDMLNFGFRKILSASIVYHSNTNITHKIKLRESFALKTDTGITIFKSNLGVILTTEYQDKLFGSYLPIESHYIVICTNIIIYIFLKKLGINCISFLFQNYGDFTEIERVKKYYLKVYILSDVPDSSMFYSAIEEKYSIQKLQTKVDKTEYDLNIFHTVKRIGLDQIKKEIGSVFYIIAKDFKANTITVSKNPAQSSIAQAKKELMLENINCIVPFTDKKNIQARSRYRAALEKCAVAFNDDGTISVTFAEPDLTASPGQSVVFYADTVCLGGGIIA
jgi:hypothetical protein